MKKSPRRGPPNRDTRNTGRPDRAERPERGRFDAHKKSKPSWGERPEKPERSSDERRKKLHSDRPERSERTEQGRFDPRKKSKPSWGERPEKPEYSRDDKRKKFSSNRPERSERPERGYDEKRKKFSANRSERPDHRPKRSHHETKRAAPPVPRIEQDPNKVIIWGMHASRAAWLNPKRRFYRVWLTEAGQKSFEKTIEEGTAELLKRPDPKRVERHEMDGLLPHGSVHQGIVLEAAPLVEPTLDDVIAGDSPPACILMLDQVTDPHNIGAILRSAAALGAGAVIMTERNAPGTTGVLAKAASGAAEYVPQIHVVNLSRALDELRQAGYWCVGLAEEGEQFLSACDLSGRTVLVLGAEGDGMRQLTRKMRPTGATANQRAHWQPECFECRRRGSL